MVLCLTVGSWSQSKPTKDSETMIQHKAFLLETERSQLSTEELQ